MKRSKLYVGLIAVAVAFTGCKKDDPATPSIPDPGESTSELLVAKFTAAPTVDGNIDEMWAGAQRLVSTAEVPSLGARNTYLNSDGAGVEENLDLFYPYNGEKYPFTFRSGRFGDRIYFLLQWQDDKDSKDRQSWYFDDTDNLWKQQHKYANDQNDKYYEDKFAILFPNGDVDGFSVSTCYATCHSTNGVIANPKDKHTRHYLKTSGQKIDMWHWKRVRGAYLGQLDDQRIEYVAPPYDSGSNGRGGDATGSSGYSDNKVTLNNGTTDVSVPKYIIPGRTNYYWIDKDEIANGTALEVVAVDGNGILTLSDNSTVDPSLGGFEKGTGNKRVPSVTIKEFTGGRADIDIAYNHTGTGWVCEFTRKLDTSDPDDVTFDPTVDLPFGLAIFNNAAIAHAIKPNLTLKFEQ